MADLVRTTLFKNESRHRVTVHLRDKDLDMWEEGVPKTLLPGDSLSFPAAFAAQYFVVLTNCEP